MDHSAYHTIRVTIHGKWISIITPQETDTIDTTPLVKTPPDPTIFGSKDVHTIIDFGDFFSSQIGIYNPTIFGEWNTESLKKEHIYIYEEEHQSEIAPLLDRITLLAQQAIANPTTYSNPEAVNEYRALTKQGYEFLLHHIHRPYPTVDLIIERAGEPCTKYLWGENSPHQQVRVSAKRIHLKNKPDTHLAVSLTWRNKEDKKKFANAHIGIADTVIASSASVIATLLDVMKEEVIPTHISLFSILSSQQGAQTLKSACDYLALPLTIHALGESDTLSGPAAPTYYLSGRNRQGHIRIVADAGDFLVGK